MRPTLRKVLLVSLHIIINCPAIPAAEELQSLSDLRLWIYIIAGPLYREQTLEARQANETFTGRAKSALLEAGLPEDAPYVGIGHSLGGTTQKRRKKI